MAESGEALTKTESEPPRDINLSDLSFIRKEMTETMQEISKIADQGAAILLLSLGAAVLLFAFLFKVKLPAAESAMLSAPEFIAAICVSMVLLLAGAAIKIYQFNKEEEAGKRVRESGVGLLHKSMDIGAALAEHKEEPRKKGI